jgi:hypothetical protein
MNLQELMKALKPVLKTVTLSNGVVLNIHRPKLSDFEKCDTPKSTLILCVADSEGNPVFSDDDTLVNINNVDTMLVNEIYTEVLGLWSANDKSEDDIEKK